MQTMESPKPAAPSVIALADAVRLRDRLEANTRFFREGLAQIGLRVLPGTHPICPVMIGDAALAAKGAQAQRPLWASTSTKNPAYRDVLYVEELIGPDTVNTMPPATLPSASFRRALRVRPGSWR